jgi:small-conductance mechanosensitive channel
MFDWMKGWPNSLVWALGLIAGIPLSLVVLSEAIVRLRRKGMPLEAPLRSVRSLVLPTLALLLLLVYVMEWDGDSIAVRVVQTLLWIFVLNASLSFLNAVLFGSAREGTWQANVPKLLRDLSRFFLVLIGVGVILSTVWGMDVGRLAAALGIGSLVLGLALQEPLGNLFSGVMLLFERPFVVGDWVRIGGDVGKVVEINWRAVHVLVGGGNEILVVPNSTLAKGNFGNISRPTRRHTESVALAFGGDAPPNRVKRVLRETALRTAGVLSDRPPSVLLVGYEGGATTYRVSFVVVDYAQAPAARDEFLTRVWYTAQRHGLTLAGAAPEAGPGGAVRAEAARAFPQFGLANLADLDRAVVKRFARGERVVAAGEPLHGLHLIVSGTVGLSVRDASGGERDVATLAPGEYFGEKTFLSGHTSDMTATALEDVELVVLDEDAVDRLLDQHPGLAHEFGAVLESRRRAAQALRRTAASGR